MAVRLAATFVLDTYARALVGSQDRPAVRGIPQHVTALLDSMAEPSVEAAGELARVLLRLRFIALYHLIELRDSAPQAIAIGEPLTADLERLLGPDHPDTLNSQNSLAAAYLAVGRTDEAIPLFEQILTARQRLLGSDRSRHGEFTEQPRRCLSGRGPGRRRDPAVRGEPGRTRAAAGRRAPQHDEFPGQPRRCLPGRGPGRRGDPAVRADPGRPGTSAGPRSPRYPDLTEQPRRCLPDAGRAAEAIPLLEATSAARKKIAIAYRDGARAAERDPAGRADLDGPGGSASCRCRRGGSGQLPPSSRRAGPAGASGRLPPSSRRSCQAGVSEELHAPGGQAGRPRGPWPDPGAARRHPPRPRGRRCDLRGRSGGHRHGLRQVRGWPCTATAIGCSGIRRTRPRPCGTLSSSSPRPASCPMTPSCARGCTR